MNLQRAFPVNQIIELETLKARDRMRHARMLQSFAGGIVNFPVFGTSDPSNAGLYYTKVELESPQREFNVQIDTGSDIVWVACITCNDCPKTSGLGIEFTVFDSDFVNRFPYFLL